MRSNRPLKELARQVLKAAEFETYSVSNVLPGDKTVSASNHVHERLRTCLAQSVGADGYNGKSPVAKTRADLRGAMLDEINQVSLDLLIRAKKALKRSVGHRGIFDQHQQRRRTT